MKVYVESGDLRTSVQREKYPQATKALISVVKEAIEKWPKDELELGLLIRVSRRMFKHSQDDYWIATKWALRKAGFEMKFVAVGFRVDQSRSIFYIKGLDGVKLFDKIRTADDMEKAREEWFSFLKNKQYIKITELLGLLDGYVVVSRKQLRELMKIRPYKMPHKRGEFGRAVHEWFDKLDDLLGKEKEGSQK